MIKIRRVNFPGADVGFIALLREFIKKSGEHERTTRSIMDEIGSSLCYANGRLWFIYDGERGDRLCGYFFADASLLHEKKCVLIHQIFLEASVRVDIFPAVHAELDDFAKEVGAPIMYFSTRRNARAWIRRLRRGWKIDSCVLSRKIV